MNKKLSLKLIKLKRLEKERLKLWYKFLVKDFREKDKELRNHINSLTKEELCILLKKNFNKLTSGIKWMIVTGEE